MPLTHSDVRKLLDLLDRAGSLESLDIRLGDFVLQARKPGAAGGASTLQFRPAESPAAQAPAAASQPAPDSATAAPASVEIPAGMTAIRAPMLGTFYRTPAPDQPPYVKEGDSVASDDTVCLVEVMKLFNTVKTPVAGRVHRILAEHGKLVQHDQVLMLIES